MYAGIFVGVMLYVSLGYKGGKMCQLCGRLRVSVSGSLVVVRVLSMLLRWIWYTIHTLVAGYRGSGTGQ